MGIFNGRKDNSKEIHDMLQFPQWLRRRLEHDAEVRRTEPHPEDYLRAEKEIRRRRIEEVASGLLLLLVLAATVAIVQIGYGIWR